MLDGEHPVRIVKMKSSLALGGLALTMLPCLGAVFDVRSFGAKGDGKTQDREAVDVAARKDM